MADPDWKKVVQTKMLGQFREVLLKLMNTIVYVNVSLPDENTIVVKLPSLVLVLLSLKGCRYLSVGIVRLNIVCTICRMLVCHCWHCKRLNRVCSLLGICARLWG